MKRSILLAVLVVAALSGCSKQDEEIKVYRLVKAPLEPGAEPAPVAVATDLPASHPPIANRADPSAPVPPNWEAQPLTEMRKASYTVHGANGSSADISFVSLGGSANDVLGNVNRWLGQIGQPPITEEQLPDVVQHLPSELGHVAVVDLRGLPEQGDPQKDGRILAAIASGTGATEFYKIRGNADLVGAEKENFLKWVAAMRSAR
jgi:hypothetical protein